MAACPHPRKVKHVSKATAVAAIESLEAAGKGNPDMSAYKCRCGAWHIGHDVRKFSKRIRRTLRARAGTDVGERRRRHTR